MSAEKTEHRYNLTAVIALPAITLALIFTGIYFEVHLVSIIPILFLAVLTILIRKELIIYLFIISFGFGYPIYTRGLITILPSDILIIPFLIVTFRSYAPLKVIQSGLFRYFSLRFIILGLVLIISFMLNFLRYSPGTIAFQIFSIMQFLKYFCLFWTGTLLGSSERQTKNIINTYIAAYIIPAAYAIFQVLKSGSLEYMATGTLGEHHSSLGTNMHIPLFLLTGMMLKDKNAGLSRIILTVFFFSALVMAQSRAALGSFLIALPALIFLKIRFKVILKAAAWFSAIILLFYFSGLFQAIFDLTFRSRYGLKIDLSSYSRLIIWQSALNFFIEAPIIQKIIGCGPGAFSQNVFFEYNFWSDKIISGGHNNFIHVLVETGIFGLLAFMFFWSSIILRSAFISRSEVNRTALYLLTVSLFISCIGQDTLWMLTWHGYLLPAYFLLLGLFSGKSDLTNSVHSPGKISSS